MLILEKLFSVVKLLTEIKIEFVEAKSHVRPTIFRPTAPQKFYFPAKDSRNKKGLSQSIAVLKHPLTTLQLKTPSSLPLTFSSEYFSSSAPDSPKVQLPSI